jgi:hypothetical protein
MQSESICAAVAAAAFLLAGGASHAQNKCFDEKGRVTYQSDPCPGASARIRTPAELGRGVAAPRPAPSAAPLLERSSEIANDLGRKKDAKRAERESPAARP